MRPLEIFIPIALAIYLLWPGPYRARAWLLPGLALLAVPLHLLVEGYRWQMIPLYILTLLLAVHGIVQRRASARLKPIAALLALLVLVLAAALPVLLPVPSIPASSGPYEVGTRIYELTDVSRQEIYSGREEARRFPIQVWYPAEPGSSGEHAPWMARADVFAPAIARYIRLPSFFLDHLELVRTPAYREARLAPAEAGYPVILFSHGWNGFNAQNTGQALELASHGYVVVGVQHTYGAVMTVFGDGTIAPNNPSALPRGAPDEEYETAARLLAAQWAGDLAYTIDFLEQQNTDAESPLYAALDLARIGAYGHSTGGGAVIQLCGTDARCKAVLGMDPFLRPVSDAVLERGVAQPAFFMFSQSWAGDLDSLNNRQFRQLMANTRQAAGVISIAGTTHYDFSDLPLLSPLAPRLGLKGPIRGGRVTVIINDYLRSFFDAALKGVGTDLFDSRNQKYNEVEFIQ